MKEDVEFYIEEKKKAEIKLDDENNMYMEATGTKESYIQTVIRESALYYVYEMNKMRNKVLGID